MSNLIGLLLSPLNHPISLCAGIAIGYLLPGDVSKAIAFIKGKL